MVLAGNALQEEPAVAMDLFADQRSNIDRSGGQHNTAVAGQIKLALCEDSILVS